jgi:RHS repeat-associated protein
VGNRLQMSSSLNAVPDGSFSYDANDRLSTDIYDNNGNTTSSAGIANTYDFENRMISHGAINIVYDGEGNRVSETVGGTTTKYLVDTLNPTHLPQVLDEIVNGAVTRTYAYGLQRIGENQQISGTWTPSFYGYDGHGNVRFLTNAAGAVTDTYKYDAFGMLIASTGTTPNSFYYSGEWLDTSAGLYYLRARFYDPATGRFWARDPVEGRKCCGLSWNPYIYVSDNAVNSVDPTGRATYTKPQPGVGGALGEYVAIIQDISIRVFILSQITIPAYLLTDQGRAVQLLVLTGVSIAVAESCKLIELTNALTEALENLSGGPFVRAPSMNCNEQPHDYEPPEEQ